MTEQQAQAAIDILANTKTRTAIIAFIDAYGDPIDWEGWTSYDILHEVWRSDEASDQGENGILAAMWAEL